MNKNKLIIIIIAAAAGVLLAVLLIFFINGRSETDQTEPEEEAELLFGLDCTGLIIDESTIGSGQTISSIFSRYGVSPATIDRTAKMADSVFSLRNIRAGNNYMAFLSADSLSSLVHFVYEQSLTDYLVISYAGDSISVRKEHKDVTVNRVIRSATIKSSLWNSMMEAGMPPALSMELSEVYAWTIDFFGLQKDDHFTVIYDQLFVDTTSVGTGRIWGAIFNHAGKDYYAIPFKQGAKIAYWDEHGNSLRKAMLKAPLKYSRISSKFSHSRLHPVLKIRRPHYGVDYAAPAGTAVHAVADGTIIFKGWDSKGGGNTLKIKHTTGALITGYLHLRGFAKGVNQGTRVSQGDLIGYVGSTGRSTGPHLDYRIWKNGKPIDPLKLTSEPAEPISKNNLKDFEFVKGRIMAELRGDLHDSLKITQLDSLSAYINTDKKPLGDSL